MKNFSMDEIARHSTRDDCWVVIHGAVYDVSAFLRDHPGGPSIIAHFAGQDITEAFDRIHRSTTLPAMAKAWRIGVVVPRAAL